MYRIRHHVLDTMYRIRHHVPYSTVLPSAGKAPLACLARQLGLALMLFVSLRAGAEESAVNFIVQTARGKDLRLPLKEIKADGSVVLGSKSDRRVAGADLLSLRRSDVPLPPFPVGAQ